MSLVSIYGKTQKQITYPGLQNGITEIQIGNLNYFGYDRMRMTKTSQTLTRDNFSPNLQHLIYYSNRTGYFVVDLFFG